MRTDWLKIVFRLNNTVFLWRNYVNYRLINARGNLMFLKQIFAPDQKQSFEGKYASFRDMKFPRGNYQTDSSET